MNNETHKPSCYKLRKTKSVGKQAWHFNLQDIRPIGIYGYWYQMASHKIKYNSKLLWNQELSNKHCLGCHSCLFVCNCSHPKAYFQIMLNWESPMNPIQYALTSSIATYFDWNFDQWQEWIQISKLGVVRILNQINR